jgi:DNA-binding FadR family transcriptional regulator
MVDTVVERIRATITEGHLKPGDRLPTETELIRQLQVSRTVLREAVTRLETLGLVSVRGSRGMFVGEPGGLINCVQMVRSALSISPRELVLFTEFRRAIECDAVRSAAVMATPEDLAELEGLCEEIGRDDLDHAAAFRVDLRFHRKLVDIAGNEMVQNVMDVVQEFVMASIIEGAPGQRDPAVTQRGHRAVLKALRARDPDAAEKAMRVHMDSVLRALHKAEQAQALSPAG